MNRVVLAWLVSLALAAPLSAATISVTTTTDEFNTDGDCSLREAIRSANLDGAVDACAAGSGADTVSIPAGTYQLAIAGAGEDAALTGDLDLVSDVTLTGAGAATTIVDGNQTNVHDRVLHVVGAVTVALSGLTLRNGDAGSGSGGCLRNAGGTVTITSATIENCTADFGGGIANSSGTLTLSGATVSGNDASTQGGGVLNGDVLVMTQTTVSGNTAGYGGGGVSHYIATSMAITDSTISNNDETTGALGGGGIIVDTSGPATITRTVISGNTAVHGGGISFGDGSSALRLVESAVSGNTADGNGGGILTVGTLEVVNSTISGNQATAYTGGGLYVWTSGAAQLSNVTIADNVANGGGGVRNDGTLTMRNTLVADNTGSVSGSGPDCGGTIASAGYNLIGDTSDCGFVAGTGDQVNASAGLAALADNGGPTRTHALLAGSAAIDGGNPGGCLDEDSAAIATDQRGETRPIGSACDVGAFELDPATVTTTTVTTSTTSPGATTTTTTLPAGGGLCVGGAAIARPVVSLGKLTAPEGNETAVLKGAMSFGAGAPATFAPATQGLQLLVDDLGAGNAAIWDLSGANAIQPGASCGGKGWSGTTYRCNGSVGGIKLIKLKDRRARGGGIPFVVKGVRARIAAPAGPLGVTIVLGTTEEAGQAGACASYAFPAHLCRRAGKGYRCR